MLTVDPLTAKIRVKDDPDMGQMWCSPFATGGGAAGTPPGTETTEATAAHGAFPEREIPIRKNVREVSLTVKRRMVRRNDPTRRAHHNTHTSTHLGTPNTCTHLQPGTKAPPCQRALSPMRSRRRSSCSEALAPPRPRPVHEVHHPTPRMWT